MLPPPDDWNGWGPAIFPLFAVALFVYWFVFVLGP